VRNEFANPRDRNMNSASSEEVSRLLERLEEGDRGVYAELLPLVYDELHAIAEGYLRRERADHTLQPTALVNEAYLRIAKRETPAWKDRRHFYRAAAAVMRSILVNHARDRRRHKRGGEAQRVPLDESLAAFEERAIDLLALDDALNRLAALDRRQSELVELRFFAGLELGQIAEILGVAERTAQADWTLARAWLRNELAEPSSGGATSENA
jgi:RNA polymerase sigma factor (TIGR02999 family)